MSKEKNIKPILTVLVPVYNTEKYIEKCLLSLANEKLVGKIEVIVVSDGSKDKSIDIAKKISKEHQGIFKIIEKENGGHGSTINVGIKKAKGKYFRVLDSDDWFDEKEFVKFINKLEKCDSDLVVTDYSKEYVNDGISEDIIYRNLKDSREYSFNKFNLKLLDSDFFAMATITYKTEILKKIKFQLPEKTFYVDMLYDVIPILEVSTFTYYKCNIYKYFIGRMGQSVNTSSYEKNHLNHNLVTHKLIDFYSDNEKNMTDIKRKYLKNIINAVINTNYSIYCIFFKNKKDGYKRVKEFDDYLKNKSLELYNETNKSYIKIFRNSKFIINLLTPYHLRMHMYKKYLNSKNKGDK